MPTPIGVGYREWDSGIISESSIGGDYTCQTIRENTYQGVTSYTMRYYLRISHGYVDNQCYNYKRTSSHAFSVRSLK